MCSSHGVLCLHIRRFLCYTAKSSKVVSYSFAVATYPREGTETFSLMRIQIIHKVATYPREGTETFCAAPALGDGVGCNLSPRGDGNAKNVDS